MRSKKTVKYLIYSFLPIIFLLLSFNVNAKRKLTYIELAPTIKSGSALNICVATLDQREVVLLEKQAPQFVGYIRSGVGIAYPIETGSGKNFSEVISTTVANALKQNGCNTSHMSTIHKSTKESVVKELKNREADIFVLITMTKWRTDTKTYAMTLKTDLIYDLTVEVYNKTGELIATNTLTQKEPKLAPSATASMKKLQAKVVNPKYPEVMTKLFANSDIEKALQ